MHVVLDNPVGDEADVELRLGGDEVTVGDLLQTLAAQGRALGAGTVAPTRGIVIDGRFCHADLALAEIGLYEGAVITPADHAQEAAPPAEGGLALRVIAGLDAGHAVALGTTEAVAGRDEDCDIPLTDDGVSRTHFAIAASPTGRMATIRDLDSINGTWVEGRRITAPTELAPGAVFEAGDVAFTVAEITPPLAVDPVRQASLGGTIAFNRPPRERAGGTGSTQMPLSTPNAPGKADKPHFSIAAAVGPLLMGAVMVIALHSILYALFMVMSPVLVVGSYVEQRRRSKRGDTGDAREFKESMETFQREVQEAQATELGRRRREFPDLGDIVNRALAPDPRLWERRPHHEDFLALSAGLGEVAYRPELADSFSTAEEAEVVLAEHGWLELAPIEVELKDAGVVGIVGERAPALAVARALICQATVLHGPADLSLAVLAREGAGGDWDWVKWLPHARDAAGGASVQLAAGDEAASALASAIAERDADDERSVLVVFDSPAMIEGRGAPGRALLRGDKATSGIVIASDADRLPAACSTVIELADEPGETIVLRPAQGQRIDPVLICGASEQTAHDCALAQAKFEDADLELAGGSIPQSVLLPGLIGLPAPDARLLTTRWARTRTVPTLTARFALTEDGPLDIDLVADGPHGLIAGTTGAGKSELLRSLVASLAADHGPTRVNFVLVDYKGGSAFAECAELPHTVGMVTDLDEQLGERALLSLEAELRYRERVLREHRASDIIEHDRLVADGRAGGDGGRKPLPRLVVIIDEFATLASELPDFIASLVGIAQRGRSLGVHMILATQRPAGAVNENIRANTNLRICLRVQTPADSSDVIDSPAAARIPRSQPGRAQIRLGPTDLVPAQTALVTGITADGPGGAVMIEPFAPGHPQPRPVRIAAEEAANGPSDLQRLVAAARAAAAAEDPPRRPWLEPLPPVVELERLLELGLPRPLAGDTGTVVSLGVADDPGAQAQYPVGWNLDAGNLLMFGIGGSGTTTALRTVIQSVASTSQPDRVHVYVMDFGAGELADMEALPHVGAVITAAEHERQVRLLRRLRGEVGARRGLDPAARARAPRIVLLIDGYAGFASEHADLGGDAVREALARVWADGPELGIHVAIGADRIGAVPMALASLAQQRLAFQLADLSDFGQFGISRHAIPAFQPGMALVGGSGQVLQIAAGSPQLTDRLVRDAALTTVDGGPPPVEVLPESVHVEALLASGRASREPLFIPVGIGDETLEPVGFELYEGEHAVIAGPPRSGRSTALRVIAEVVARLYPDIAIVGIATRRSPLGECAQLSRHVTDPAEIPALVEQLTGSERTHLLLIDDGDQVQDTRRALTELFSVTLPHVHGIVAGRGDELRGIGHWASGARKSRIGLLLQPDVQVDGMLFGITLPRRPSPPARPGCGYRVGAGGFEIVQVAVAESGDPSPDSVLPARR